MRNSNEFPMKLFEFCICCKKLFNLTLQEDEWFESLNEEEMIKDPPSNFFLLAVKKTTDYSLDFFSFEITILLIKENHFIQMAASAGHAIAYKIVPISIICSCISPMGPQILSFKASLVSGMSA